ncbi:aminomethyltransferase beta-barrel domain-containing protein [Candidatus Vidania fulgoroideorum]
MKIISLLSGGVDSTISTLILKKLKIFFYSIYIKTVCKKKEIIRCIEISKFINIKIKIIKDKKYKKILKKLIKNYKKNKSMNPDIICNKKIKFFFKNKIITTGHYAKKIKNKIKESIDKKKDQTYFLCELKKKKKVFFPIGFFLKKQIIFLCKFLIFKNNESSRGVCFLNNTKNIFKKNFSVIGQCAKTVGEKKYIYKKKGNNIFITKKKNTKLYKRIFYIKFKKNEKFDAKINSRSKKIKCFTCKGKIIFIYPVRNINPGQYIVFYKKKYLIGGYKIL